MLFDVSACVAVTAFSHRIKLYITRASGQLHCLPDDSNETHLLEQEDPTLIISLGVGGTVVGVATLADLGSVPGHRGKPL